MLSSGYETFVHFTLAPARAALGNGKFAAYLAVSCLADCGYWISIVAQGWLVLRLTHSPVWLGIIGAAAQSPALFMSLVGGVLADRVDRRLVIVVVESIVGIVALITAFFIARDSLGVVGLCLLAFATGTMLAIEHPVDRAFIYELIEGEDVEQSVALSSVEFSIARTAGPALGGIAIATLGISGGYVLQAACVVPIVVFGLYAVRAKIGHAVRTSGARVSDSATLAEGWRYVVKERSILIVCVLTAIFTIGISPYVWLLADIAKNTLHLHEAGYGALQAAGGVGALAGALALTLSRETKHMRTVIVGAILAGAVSLALMTTLRAPILAGIALFVLGAVDSVVYALGNTYVQERTDERHRGRVNAFFTIAFLGGIPVGDILIGGLAAKVGSEWALFLGSIAVGLCAIAFFLVSPKLATHAQTAPASS